MSGGVSPLAMLRELNRAGVVTAGALADFAGIAGTRGTNLAALLAFAARRGGFLLRIRCFHWGILKRKE